MFTKILNNMTGNGDVPMPVSKRKHPRRSCDQCVTVIGERMYPLVDWSMGGIQITGDERLFGVSQQIDIVLKFRTEDRIIDVPHKARVVRKTKNRVAFEFLPLTQNVKRKFQSIIDDFTTREFVESQMV